MGRPRQVGRYHSPDRPTRAGGHGARVGIAAVRGNHTMARVVAFGGLFFKSQDPEKLLAWYAKWLGIGDGKSSVEFPAGSLPARSFTVWSPFMANTDYF